MKAYLAIKFHKDCKNRKLIEDISESMESAGIKSTVIIRDYENWCSKEYSPDELMKLTFKIIDESEIVVVEFSENSIGAGIEAGYGYANKKPIIVIAKQGSEIPTTIRGIATKLIFYEKPEELTKEFERIKKH